MPTIYLFRREGVLLKEVPADIDIFGTKSAKTKVAFWKLAVFLKKNPFDLIYSVTDGANIASLIALKLFSNDIKIVCSSHSTFTKINFKSKFQKKVTFALINYLYKSADALIGISKDAVRSYQDTFVPLKHKFQCIYNAAFTYLIFSQSLKEIDDSIFAPSKVNLFTCGRLVKPKGLPFLIDAVRILNVKYNINLVIAGEGSDRSNLEEQICALGLNSTVSLLGNQNNPYKYMSKCDIYVHSSLWDGLPTTLIEAMACGAAVVSTDCDSGPREIITHEVDGLLVRPPGNAEALVKGIERLILDEELRLRLKKNAVKRAQFFSSENIVKQYENLFLEVMVE